MQNPLVSIVTICWNRKDDILESLQGISRIDYENIEIILVDNHSTDNTTEAVETLFPKVKLIKMTENTGIKAYNVGFQKAVGEYIVILDDDSFPAPDSIRKMVDRFREDPLLGVAAFDVRNYYHYDEITNSTQSPAQAPAEISRHFTSFNGAGAGVRRDLLARVGYYPEEFFLYWNEADTSFRILDLGYKITFFPDIVSYHKFSPKNRASWRAPFYCTRNMFWLVWKNYPCYMAVRMTIRFIFDCFYYSFEQRTFLYIRAMLNAFRYMEQPLQKRKPVKEEIWKNMRLVFRSSFTSYK